MKMSLARALREKNRLQKEIDRLWELFQRENSCLKIHKRTADVKQTLQTIEHYTAKLVELKTKIGNANQPEQFRNIHLLDETKNRLAKFSSIIDRDHSVLESAVFDDTVLLKMKHQLQLEANAFQDKIDLFNASTQIEFESPID